MTECAGCAEPVSRVLGACARVAPDEWSACEIRRALNAIADWDDLIRRAERNGLGPLVYTHLNVLGAALPIAPRFALRALYLRHQQAERIRFRTLQQVLSALEKRGIRPLVLKGAALAHLIYPEPGLRPMGDMDLLVERRDLGEAVRALVALGFAIPEYDLARLPEKHLLATAPVDDLTVKIELHYDLFSRESRRQGEWKPVLSPPLKFRLDQRTAQTLPVETLLGHLARHLVFHADVFTPIRLIWVADIVGLVEHFASRIDWELVRTTDPIVLNVLSLLQVIHPLPEDVLRVAPVRLRASDGTGWADFDGWPRAPLATFRARGKSHPRIALDTLFPPTWWLRLHHGLGISDTIWQKRWVEHPAEILGWYVQLLRTRPMSKPDED